MLPRETELVSELTGLPVPGMKCETISAVQLHDNDDDNDDDGDDYNGDGNNDNDNNNSYNMFPFLLAVFEPESIRKQMVFQRWIMLKMFLTAIASGACKLLI